MADLYIISPVFNEEANIVPFCKAIKDTHADQLAERNLDTHLVMIDDGSSDQSFQRISENRALGTGSFTVAGLSLSRNFGQQAAIHAGLTHCFNLGNRDSLFIVMDSDLQHPPRHLPEMIDAINEGADHVQMLRIDSTKLSFFKNVTSKMFYSVFRYLTRIELKKGSSDFRGMSYPVVKAYLRLDEKGRFNRGLFHWIGFSRREIMYTPDDRTRGESKYTLKNMIMLAVAGISQFSSKPLIFLTTVITLFSFVTCFFYFLYEFYLYLNGVEFVLGWRSVIFVVTFWGGAISLSQLLISVYVSRIFDESKNRPIYIVGKTTDDS